MIWKRFNNKGKYHAYPQVGDLHAPGRIIPAGCTSAITMCGKSIPIANDKMMGLDAKKMCGSCVKKINKLYPPE